MSAKSRPCGACRGTGQRSGRCVNHTGSDCRACDGSGTFTITCATCGGRGQLTGDSY